MATDTKTTYEQWSLVEIMGHQQLAGLVTETVIAGAAMLRVDVPEVEGVAAFTTFLGASSIYRLTPVTEEIARRYAASLKKQPVYAYQLPALPSPSNRQADIDDDDDLVDEILSDLDDE